MRRPYRFVLGSLLLLFVSFKLVDWGRHRHLVTIDVDQGELRSVLQDIARQSEIRVLSRTNATASITLHVHRVPAETALDAVAEQSDGRWQRVFLVGNRSQGIRELSNQLAEKGPPFLVTQMAGRETPFAAEGASSSQPPSLFSLQSSNREFQTAALELALKARTPIMVQESLNPMTNIEIKNQPLPSAVKQLAHAAGAQAEMVYYFRTARGSRWVNAGDGPPSDRGEATPAVETIQERVQAREKLIDQQLALLSPEDQQKIQQWREEQQHRRAEWARLTPEERQQKLAALANDSKAQERFDKRNLDRIKNLTPEQRVERYQRFSRNHR